MLLILQNFIVFGRETKTSGKQLYTSGKMEVY